MRRNRTIPGIVLAALALPALVFAACGGDDSDSNESSATTGGQSVVATSTPRAEGQGTSAPAPGATTATGSATVASGGTGQVTGSGAAALQKLAKDVTNKVYQASYELEMTDTDGTVQKGTMTLANKPPGNAYSFEVDGEKLLIINDGTYNYFCSAVGAGGQCLKSKTSADSAGLIENPFNIDSLLADMETDTEVTATRDERIAGIDSQCFILKSDGEEGVACFSKADGLLTRAEGGSDGTKVRIVATKLEKSVDDKLLAPPAGFQIMETGQ